MQLSNQTVFKLVILYSEIQRPSFKSLNLNSSQKISLTLKPLKLCAPAPRLGLDRLKCEKFSRTCEKKTLGLYKRISFLICVYVYLFNRTS